MYVSSWSSGFPAQYGMKFKSFEVFCKKKVWSPVAKKPSQTKQKTHQKNPNKKTHKRQEREVPTHRTGQ